MNGLQNYRKKRGRGVPIPGYPRAKTTTPFAGITTFADCPNPCIGGPDAVTPAPFPATWGLTQLSYTSLLKTSFQNPPPGKPIPYPHQVDSERVATTITSSPESIQR